MITVIGMDGSPLTPAAEAALATATLIVAARRHLATLPSPASASTAPAPPGGSAGAPAGRPARTVLLGELGPALDALAAHDGDAVVLASGDPGFFGVVRALRGRGLPVTVLPAVSSVALAFARAGLPWDDAVVVSAHGRDPRPAVNVCRAHPKVAVLTGPGAGPAELGAALDGWDRQLIICEQLGAETERVTACSPAAAASRAWPGPSVVLVLASSAAPPGPPTPAPAIGVDVTPTPVEGGDTHPQRDLAGPGWMWPRAAPGVTPATLTTAATVAAPELADMASAPGTAAGWALAEGEFDSRDAVITKAEVRALALARLAPAPGTLVWDVGAGTGSVAVECARFGAAVIAVERDPRRCARITTNAARHGAEVRVVSGTAPAALAGLPDPDAVFVGGGAPAALGAVIARRPARIVVAVAALERAGPVHAELTAAGYATDGVLLRADRFAPLPGDVHRLAATNPVFLIWAGSPASVPGKLP